MLRKSEFCSLMDNAIEEAKYLEYRSSRHARVVLLVSPDVAYEYFGNEFLGQHPKQVAAYGYNVYIVASDVALGKYFVKPAVDLASPWLDCDDYAYPGLMVISEGELYVCESRFDSNGLHPIRYVTYPGKIVGFSDIRSITSSFDGSMTFEFATGDELNFWDSPLPRIYYDFEHPISSYKSKGASFNAPIDRDEVDTSELLQFLNTFNVNNEQLLCPG